MESIKSFIRKQWTWIAAVLCLLAILTWSSGGSIIGGALTCAVTAYINYLILKWLLPERAQTMFVRMSMGIKYAIAYLGAGVLMLGLSLARTGLPEAFRIDVGAILSFLLIGAAEVFLIIGPVHHLMMNRYAEDETGVFLACLFTGLAYGISYFAYGFIYLTDLEGATFLSVFAQAVYITLVWTFLSAAYEMTGNFFLILIIRIIGLVLERGMEIVTEKAVSVYNIIGLNTMDCIIIIIIGAALGLLTVSYISSIPPWESGDFRKRKKRTDVPITMQNPRLEQHRDSIFRRKKK